jgi:hypothetical protein
MKALQKGWLCSVAFCPFSNMGSGIGIRGKKGELFDNELEQGAHEGNVLGSSYKGENGRVAFCRSSNFYDLK